MDKYRKRVNIDIVEAIQYAPNMAMLPDGVVEDSSMSDSTGYIRAYATTIHGQKVSVEPGDWIIKVPGVAHCYLLEPGVFEAVYEPV